MGKYFGTDGYRGEANVTLTSDNVYKVGRFLGYYLNSRKQNKERARVVVGKDTRRSSYMIEYVLSGALASSGVDVYLMHVTTTPSVSFITRTDSFDAGIMITASHNPFYDNGIKLFNSNGEKIEDEVIEEIEKYLEGETGEIPLSRGEDIGTITDFFSGRNRYIGYLISLGIYSFRGLRIALDTANGSTWSIAKAVFEALGANVSVINNNPDGLNINKDAGSTHIGNLKKFVVETKSNIGFAFDGDGDRCIAVDENGEVIDGDDVIYIYSKYMKDRGKLLTNTVVVTQMSNYGLFKALENNGIDYKITKVGDRFVYREMVEGEHRLGGEQSGHIIFSKYANSGDGILTALKLTEVMLARKVSASEMKKGFVKYPQVLINVRVGSKKNEIMSSPEINKMVEDLNKKNNDGRILLRASGTEPLIRIMVESKSEENAISLAKAIEKIVVEHL